MVVFSLILSSCSGGSDKQTEDVPKEKLTTKDGETKDAPTNMKEAMKDMEKAIKKIENSERVEPVNFRELKKLLPEEFANLKRKSISGESSGAMGMKVSMAEATYVMEKNDSRIDVDIVDTGGIGFGGVGMAMAAWAMMDIDKEDDNGYERSIMLDGNKAFEQYKYNSKFGEIAVLVEGRFVVTFSASGLEMKELKSIVKTFDFKALKRMV